MPQINAQHKVILEQTIDLDRLLETKEELKENFEALKENYATRGTMIEQYRERIDSLQTEVEHSQKVQQHLSETIRELQGEKKTHNDEVKALKDTIKK